MPGTYRVRSGWIATLVLGLLLLAASAQAGLRSAELQVNGLSCPFCAFGIEKKLLRIDGVRDVEVLLDEGRVAVTFAPQSAATVADLDAAVAKAGFELAALRVEADGQLREVDGPRLVSTAEMTFRLAETRDGTTRPVSAETLERLRQGMAGDDGTVVLSGTVEAFDGAEPTLVLDGAETLARARE